MRIPSHDGAVHPSQVLRQLADDFQALATALEWQHNAQNNQLAAALGNAELGLENRLDILQEQLDALRAELKERAVGHG